jgi:hypothetical protein
VVLRFCHILGRSWSEQKCAFGALPRPGRQTYCAIVKVDNGGDGHFQAEAAVQCLTSFGGFLPNQPQTQSSKFCKHYQHWHVTDFLTGGMSICTPGFPTPLACKYKDHSATVVIAMQQHHHRSTFVSLLASCIILQKSRKRCDDSKNQCAVVQAKSFLCLMILVGQIRPIPPRPASPLDPKT